MTDSSKFKSKNTCNKLTPGPLRLTRAGLIMIFLCFAFFTGCIEKFTPKVTEDQALIVVEGHITDQQEMNVIKISTSSPLGIRSLAKPLSGCNVFVSDDLGNNYILSETTEGTYTNPGFQGTAGRYYTLHVYTNDAHNNLSYESEPELLKPVPPIDSVYYKKMVLSVAEDGSPTAEGCQIYLDTHDPDNICKFYRWEFVETWSFSLPYYVENAHCWISENSGDINIKNNSSLTVNQVTAFPIKFVTNSTDRLKEKYSILVNQYSINEDEYVYWEKLQSLSENVGSLYDIIPSSIKTNIKCVEDPNEKVLGFFSVSGVKSKRLFIHEFFRGMVDLYKDCGNEIVYYLSDDIPGLNEVKWVISYHSDPPPYWVLTYFKGCADCSVRGTTIQPPFWNDGK